MDRLSLGDFLELYVCIILTIEFWYDWKLNQHVKKMKQRTKRRFEFEELTKGEGK